MNIKQQDLTVGALLGRGTSGAVYKGVWTFSGEQKVVAIKQVYIVFPLVFL